MALFNPDLNDEMKTLVDEAAAKLKPLLTAAISQISAELPKAIVDALDGLTITITRKQP